MEVSQPLSELTRPSALHLPRGEWQTVLDCLSAHFPVIGRQRWLDRIERGRVLDEQRLPIDAAYPYREGLRIYYFREVANEASIPFFETVLYADEHLIVADKPHFLPVTPAGQFVEETLLTRLIRRFDNPHLVPLHRIDRHTAGLVLFSANRDSRTAYQALFRERKIVKRYDAIAPALPQLSFPLRRETRMVAGEPFFRMQEIAGTPNTDTRIEVCDCGGDYWRYALYPVTGKKHQLRVHMAALGAAICNDTMYPALREQGDDDHSRPLKLLARCLEFTDPLTAERRYFESQLQLI